MKKHFNEIQFQIFFATVISCFISLPSKAQDSIDVTGHYHIRMGKEMHYLDISDSLVVWDMVDIRTGKLNREQQTLDSIELDKGKQSVKYEFRNDTLSLDAGHRHFMALKVEPDNDDYITHLFRYQPLEFLPPLATDTSHLVSVEGLEDMGQTHWGQLPHHRGLRTGYSDGTMPYTNIAHLSDYYGMGVHFFFNYDKKKEQICGRNVKNLVLNIDEKVPLGMVFRLLYKLKTFECPMEKVYFAMRVIPETGTPHVAYREMDLPAFQQRIDALFEEYKETAPKELYTVDDSRRPHFLPFPEDDYTKWLNTGMRMEYSHGIKEIPNEVLDPNKVILDRQ